jgi:hypothetical protein
MKYFQEKPNSSFYVGRKHLAWRYNYEITRLQLWHVKKRNGMLRYTIPATVIITYATYQRMINKDKWNEFFQAFIDLTEEESDLQMLMDVLE